MKIKQSKNELLEHARSLGIAIDDPENITKKEILSMIEAQEVQPEVQAEAPQAESSTPAVEVQPVIAEAQPIAEAAAPSAPAVQPVLLRPVRKHPKTKSRNIRKSVYAKFDELLAQNKSVEDYPIEEFVQLVLSVAPTWVIQNDPVKISKHLSWYKSTYRKEHENASAAASAPVAPAALPVTEAQPSAEAPTV